MATSGAGKSEGAGGKGSPATRTTYAVDRAFVEDGVYYAGQNVPEIGQLPKAVIQDRIDRGYIREYQSHAPAEDGTAATSPAE